MGQVIVDRELLLRRVAEVRGGGRSVVFANGAFDLIHVGHVRYLQGAAAEGDVLIVGVNSDESIRGNKGPHRPLQPLAERMEIVAAFDGVAIVTPFAEPTCSPLLELIRPDVHAKGPDYTPENLPEYPTLQRLGIRLAIVGDPKDHSSSTLIDRLQRDHGQSATGAG
jgi:rfaE bifunctional protein nucleotidyltransferase chain/domain